MDHVRLTHLLEVSLGSKVKSTCGIVAMALAGQKRKYCPHCEEHNLTPMKTFLEIFTMVGCGKSLLLMKMYLFFLNLEILH